MTLQERAMECYGTDFEKLDKMTQESVRKDCVSLASEDMLEVLRDAKLQIEYLHDKFRTTGTGNAVVSQIESVIAKAEGRA